MTEAPATAATGPAPDVARCVECQQPDTAALSFFNVNEEGEVYGEHDSIEAALAILEQFPNDSVVVCYADSPVAQQMKQPKVLFPCCDHCGCSTVREGHDDTCSHGCNDGPTNA